MGLDWISERTSSMSSAELISAKSISMKHLLRARNNFSKNLASKNVILRMYKSVSNDHKVHKLQLQGGGEGGGRER